MNQTIARAIGVLIALLTAFFGSQPWASSVEQFLAAVEQALIAGSGTIPAIKLGTTWFGPIPFGPNEPAA